VGGAGEGSADEEGDKGEKMVHHLWGRLYEESVGVHAVSIAELRINLEVLRRRGGGWGVRTQARIFPKFLRPPPRAEHTTMADPSREVAWDMR
jgi:hypothetical protein